MTHLAELIEKEYKNFSKLALPRKEVMINIGTITRIAYCSVVTLAKLFPEHFSSLEEYTSMDTIEYIKLSARGYLRLVLPFVVSSAFMPEYYKISTWILFKPLKIVGKGIDCISQ